MTKAILIAVEPLAVQIPKPVTKDTMAALVGHFLTPSIPVSMEGDYDEARFRVLPGAYFLARWPTGTGWPIQIYAWTDGKILLIALYEDVQYVGPGPAQ